MKTKLLERILDKLQQSQIVGESTFRGLDIKRNSLVTLRHKVKKEKCLLKNYLLTSK